MTQPTLNATDVTFAKIATPGAAYTGFGVGENAGGDFYIEFAQFSPGYLAAKSTWPITDFTAIAGWPIELKAVTAKGRSFSISADVTTGTATTAGFRVVTHSNKVEIPATMARTRVDGKLPPVIRALKKKFAQRVYATAL